MSKKDWSDKNKKISATLIQRDDDWHYVKYTDSQVWDICNAMVDMLDSNKVSSLLKALRIVKVPKTTFYDTWPKRFSDKPEFLELFAEVRDAAEANIVESALKNQLNPVLSKFYLTNAFGYMDKILTNHQNNGESFDALPPITISVREIPKSVKNKDGAGDS